MTDTDRRPEGYPATPELDKQLEIVKSGRAATVQDFLDWLLDEKGLVLGEYTAPSSDNGYQDMVPVFTSREHLMAEHFGVDLDAVERERRAVLEWVRSQPERQR